MKEIVLENHHTSLRELSSELIIAYGTSHHIVIDILGIRRVTARLILKDPTFFQNHHLKMGIENLISEVKNNVTFMKLIITDDETWVFEYDVGRGQQSSEKCLKNEPKNPTKVVKSYIFVGNRLQFSRCYAFLALTTRPDN